jgi:hypothetical protein
MRNVLLCLLTVSSAAWPSVAGADPIRITLDRREAAANVFVGVGPNFTLVQDRQVSSDDLSASVSASREGVSGSAAATLSSRVIGNQISGAGSVSATATVPLSTDIFRSSRTSTNSEVILLFELGRPHLFDFSGVFDATSGVGSNADLSGPFSLVIFQTPPMSSGQVRERGLLPAGVWGLRVFQMARATVEEGFGGAASEHGQVSFTFDLTAPSVVPEPASVVLLGSGLLGLLGVRRRRN